jgi:hypothetical protein
VAVPVKLPDVPVTVTVEVPIAAVPVAVRVRRLAVVAGFVPKTALTPFGSPATTRFTVLLNPFRALMAIVAEPPAPWRKVRLVGDADSVKLGCCAEPGQLFTRLAALTVPMPVAKSQPVVVPYAGAKELFEVESTPTVPPARKQLGPAQSTSMSPEVTS